MTKPNEQHLERQDILLEEEQLKEIQNAPNVEEKNPSTVIKKTVFAMRVKRRIKNYLVNKIEKQKRKLMRSRKQHMDSLKESFK